MPPHREFQNLARRLREVGIKIAHQESRILDKVEQDTESWRLRP